jgi:hypothetical protein
MVLFRGSIADLSTVRRAANNYCGPEHVAKLMDQAMDWGRDARLHAAA